MMNCASENTILQSDEEQATVEGFQDRGSRSSREIHLKKLNHLYNNLHQEQCSVDAFKAEDGQLLVSLHSVFDDRNHNVKKDSIAGQW